MPTSLRLGTRGSLLARTQSQLVAAAIERANPSVQVELIIIKTTGDQVQDRPLADLGGKGLFTKEIEQALLRSEIDVAVHSYKDVPVTMPLVDVAELVISCVPSREDARDVLITRDAAQEIATLPPGARVGTGSLRRRCQLLERRPDLVIEPIRGNIETRLRKLNEGEYDAILLAFAGLKRAGLFDAGVMTLLDIETLTPAAGQGALALQTRRDDAATIALLEPLHDVAAATAVDAERALVRLLEGDCHAPIAAFASLNGDTLTLRGALGAAGGNAPVKRGQATVTPPDAEAVAEHVRQQIQAL